jgi:small-conductance mechanosensitive channel
LKKYSQDKKDMPKNFEMIIFLGNSLKDYIVFGGAFFAFLLIFKIFQSIVLGRLTKIAERTKNDIDDEFIKIVRSIKPPFYSFLAFYFALRFLTLNEFLSRIFDAVLIIWFVYQLIGAVQILIDYVVRKKFAEESRESRAAAGALGIAVKFILWSLAFLLILQNLGVNVTSLIAGLGIGGIAVALAVQNILGDLLSSFAIYFDKPFKPGDFIVVGNTLGTVEKIGVKTTRLRALQGEEVVMPNKELTGAKIQNFKKMEKRRVDFTFGIVYETPVEKLKKIPGTIKEIFDSISLAALDRVHFKEFGDFALVFEVVYYVESPDYNRYMDIQQEINLKIKEKFEKEGIVFAYPTQTIFVNQIR